MANSTFIGKAKNKIIKAIIKDNDIITAIGSEISTTTPEKYIGTHIFNYNRNPFTLNKAITFITVQVHIPQVRDRNGTFVSPTIEIWVVTHEDHMNVDNVPKVNQNRNDYIGELIDKKFNGTNGFGIGTVYLQSSYEGAFQQDYLYRKLVFVGTDLNDSLCDEED